MKNLTLSGKHFYSFIGHLENHPGIKSLKFKGYGQSMTPFIKNGSTMNINLLDEKTKIIPGDIVLIKHLPKKEIFIHRVIKAQQDRYLIKGDNKKYPDGWFSRATIMGKVTRINNGSELMAASLSSIPKRTIALLSRTGFLNAVILPGGRWIKHHLEKRRANG